MAQLPIHDTRIDLCGLDVGMAEHFRHTFNGYTFCQANFGRERMTSLVGNHWRSKWVQNGELKTQAVNNERIFNIWKKSQKRILEKCWIGSVTKPLTGCYRKGTVLTGGSKKVWRRFLFLWNTAFFFAMTAYIYSKFANKKCRRMQIEKFNVLLYLHTTEPDKSGTAPIMGIITVHPPM